MEKKQYIVPETHLVSLQQSETLLVGSLDKDQLLMDLTDPAFAPIDGDGIIKD